MSDCKELMRAIDRAFVVCCTACHEHGNGLSPVTHAGAEYLVCCRAERKYREWKANRADGPSEGGD
jgi:hypothetical protein